MHNGGTLSSALRSRAHRGVMSYAGTVGSTTLHAGTISAGNVSPPADSDLPLSAAQAPSDVAVGGRALVVKHVLDRIAALTALVLLSPLLIVIACAVRCSSRGPALFRQTRIGRGGRPFTMLKFRSMHAGAETRLAELLMWNDSAGGVLFKLRDDPRTTPVGRVLRRLSLDELPQLLNVLGGSMSLVGPRPPLPSEVARYDAQARRRLLVKPGLTGLWQVSGRSNLSWEESIRLDLDYIERWSLALDTVVLLRTLPAVLRADGAY